MNTASTAYQHAPDPVPAGQRCLYCKYDLTGLGIGMPCPECGTPIGSAKRTSHILRSDSIAFASNAYLRRTAAAALTLGISGLVMLVLSVIFVFFDPKYVAWTVFFACTAQAVAAIVVFLPRTNPSVPDAAVPFAANWGTLRLISTLSQCFWIPAGICTAIGFYTQMQVFEWLAIASIVIATFGIAPSSWLLADHADWSNDVALGLRLRAVIWMMAFSTLYFLVGTGLAMLGSGFGVLMLSFGFFINLLFPLAMALYFISALQYASNASWAIVNAREEADRAARMAERARKQEEEAAARQPAFTPPPSPGKHLVEEINRKHEESLNDPDLIKAQQLIGRSGNRVIGRSDAETYALEDDQNPATDP